MAQLGEQKKIWVTLTGLPLTIELEWPFHRSTSGADFWVLHGEIRLENSDGLHAPVAVNLSATVREVMASLEPKDAEAPVINALRKEVDRRQIEFVKSGKLKPVAFSSRHYDFKREKWVFGKAGDDEIADVCGAEGLLGDEVEIPTSRKRREKWGTPVRCSAGREASLDWGSDGRAVFGDYSGAFAGDCRAAGSRGWIGADRWRVGGSYRGVDGAGGTV